MSKSYTLSKSARQGLNRWDVYALIIVFGLLSCITWATMQMSKPYDIGNPPPIHLDPKYLPGYALRSFLRMLIAMFVSLLATFTIGSMAAKSKKAESIIVPAIDILQSIPVLSFLTITVVGFIKLFPGNMLGPEMASIFAIFTAQAWNMILGFYQSLKSIPKDLNEVAKMYHLSWWRKFWKIEVPFAMPGLIWNMMISMSASWFFVVASETIAMANQVIFLPGVGSYIGKAISMENYHAIFYAIICMIIVIVIYDQIFFRPLLYWSEKFHSSNTEITNRSWFVTLLQRTKILKYISYTVKSIYEKLNSVLTVNKIAPLKKSVKINTDWFWYFSIVFGFMVAVYFTYTAIKETITLKEISLVTKLGIFTSIRVMSMVFLASIIWVPVGVWIGLRPNLAKKIQPIIQFLAAFPANLLFSLVVVLVLKYNLNPEIWTSPLIILGSQWYILFNVIVGTLSISKDLHHAVDNLGVKSWLWWKSFILPGILPFYVTGAITAAGAAWNASIIAEYVTWGPTVIQATGLGSYIAKYFALGISSKVILGTVAMCIYVIAFNKLVWQPLYNYANARNQT